MPATNQYDARLIYSASESDANMLWATRFFAPDPFIFIEKRGKRYLVMSDLEIDRAKNQASVDTVLAHSAFVKRLQQEGTAFPGAAQVLAAVFRDLKIKKVEVPSTFPVGLADQHNQASGPIRANTSIIMDIFPRSQATGYCGDITRTVVRGRASERLKQAYGCVEEGQKIGFRRIRHGANAFDIHQEILNYFG